MKRSFWLLPIMLFIVSFAVAQTVTVDAGLSSPNNTSTFSSLQVAISSFQASGEVTAGTGSGGVGVNHGNAAADVINIITATAIDEVIIADAAAASGAGQHVLDENITIQGSGVRGIVCVRINGISSVDAATGIFMRQDVNIAFKNMAFLPSKTGTLPTSRGALFFQATANAKDTVVSMDNVIVTANNGSNLPLTTTGLDNPSTASPAVVFPTGLDCIWVRSRTEGGSLTLNATDLILSSWSTDIIGGGGTSDGIVFYMNGTTIDVMNAIVNLGPGCVISNCPRFGVQNTYGGILNINGTKAKPVIFNNLGADGVWNYSDTSITPAQPTMVSCNYAIFNKVKGAALKEQETRGAGFVKSVRNSIFSNCTEPAIALFATRVLTGSPAAAGVTSTVEISTCTIHNCGYSSGNTPAWSFGAGAPTYSSGGIDYKTNRNVVVTNTIITGAGLTGIYYDGTGTCTVDYSSLCTSNLLGNTYALGAATGGTTAVTLGSHVINDDPIYDLFGVTDFASSRFMDVRNNAFAGKGAGIDLAGGADYIGDYVPPTPTPAPAGAQKWNVYE